LGELTGTGYWEGLYLIDRLNQSLGVAGDVCEFGVAQGATSALLANEIRSTDKVLWLFDTFAGLPEPGKEDVLLDDIFDLGSADRYVGTMAYPADNVRDRLAGIGFADARIRIVKGRIEETLGGDRLPDRVCFAYLDVDLYGGTKAALEFLHTRLEPKGHVVVDDYGFFTEGPQRAVDEFLGVHPGEYQLDLPDPRAGKFCLLSRL
jgi:O-methyltransferase